MRRIFLLRLFVVAVIPVLAVSVSFSEGVAVYNKLEKRVGKLRVLVNSQKKEMVDFSRKISNLNSAIMDMNKKYFGIEDSIRMLKNKQVEIAGDNLEARSLLKRSNEDAGNMSLLLAEHKELVDELNQRVKLLGRSLLSLQEKQSLGEYALKKEYAEAAEERRKTSIFLNMVSIVVALLALGIAL